MIPGVFSHPSFVAGNISDAIRKHSCTITHYVPSFQNIVIARTKTSSVCAHMTHLPRCVPQSSLMIIGGIDRSYSEPSLRLVQPSHRRRFPSELRNFYHFLPDIRSGFSMPPPSAPDILAPTGLYTRLVEMTLTVAGKYPLSSLSPNPVRELLSPAVDTVSEQDDALPAVLTTPHINVDGAMR